MFQLAQTAAEGQEEREEMKIKRRVGEKGRGTDKDLTYNYWKAINVFVLVMSFQQFPFLDEFVSL